MKLPFNLKPVITALAISLGLIGAAHLATAQQGCSGPLCYLGGSNQTFPIISPTNTNTNTDCVGNTCPLSGSGSRAPTQGLDPKEVMANVRQEDRQRCEAEFGFNSLVNKPGSLSNILQQQLTQRFNQTLQNIIQEKIPGIIQNKLRNTLPGLLQRGLRNELPNRVNQEIANRFRQGQSAAAIREQLPAIISTAAQQLIPQIIRVAVPAIVQQGLEENLPAEISEQIKGQVPEIINTSDIPDRVNELTEAAIETAADANNAAVEEIEDLRKNNNAGIIGFNGSLYVDLDDVDTRVSNSERETISSTILESVTESAAEGAANSPAINDIANSITPLLTDALTRQIIPNILNTIQGGFSSSGGFGGSFDSTVGGLFGSNYDLSGGISGDFFNPIVQEMTPALGQWSYEATTNLITPQAALSPEALNVIGAEVGDNIDMSQMGARFSSISNDASGLVNSNAADIGSKAGFAQGLEGLGDSMKGALAGSVGSMVGGLVGNVPFVGGLIGPIAEQMVTQAMTALLGLPTTSVGFPVADVGLGVKVSQGFQGIGKITGEVAANTGQSNQNEQQIIKTQNKELEIAVQTCTLEKAMKRMAEAQEDKERVLDPNASKSTLLRLIGMIKGASNFFSQSYDPGTKGQGVTNPGQPEQRQGESFVKDPELDAARASDEATKREVTRVAESQNPNKDAVIAQIQKDVQSPFGRPLASGICEQLDDPEKVAQMSSKEFAQLDFECSNPINHERGLYVLTKQNISTAQAAAAQLERDKFIAYGGIRETRVCAGGWTNDPLQADPSYNLGDVALPGNNGDILADTALGNNGQYCRRWATQTPGSLNMLFFSNLLAGMIQKLVMADEVGEDVVNDYAKVSEDVIRNVSGANNEAIYRPSSDPCPGPDGCPGTGWNTGQTAASSLSDAFSRGLDQGLSNTADNLGNLLEGQIDDLLSGNLGGGSGGGGSINVGDIIGGVNFNLNNFDFSAPAIQDPSAVSISMQQSTSDLTADMSEITVSWNTSNARVCYADNDWLSGPVGNTQVEKRKDDTLGLSGQLRFAYPKTSTVNANYEMTCYGDNGSVATQTIKVSNQ